MAQFDELFEDIGPAKTQLDSSIAESFFSDIPDTQAPERGFFEMLGDLGTKFRSTTKRIIGNVADLSIPDPQPDPIKYPRFQLDRAVAGSAQGFGDFFGIDRLANFGRRKNIELDELVAAENTRRKAAGLPTLEEERQAQMSTKISQAASRQAQELEEKNLSEKQKFLDRLQGEAIQEGAIPTAKFLAKYPSAILSTGVESLPYMLAGGGTALTVRKLAEQVALQGPKAVRRATIAGSIGGESLAASGATAQQAKEAIDRLSDEDLAKLPEYQEILEIVNGDMVQARGLLKDRAVNTAYVFNLFTNIATLGLAQKAGFNVVADVLARTSRGTSRTLPQVAKRFAQEATQEAVQEPGDTVAQNLGEVVAGIREPEALIEGIGGSAVIGAATGGPLGGATALAPAAPEIEGADPKIIKALRTALLDDDSIRDLLGLDQITAPEPQVAPVVAPETKPAPAPKPVVTRVDAQKAIVDQAQKAYDKERNTPKQQRLSGQLSRKFRFLQKHQRILEKMLAEEKAKSEPVPSPPEPVESGPAAAEPGTEGAATLPPAETPIEPRAFKRGANTQAVQLADGTWQVRVKQSGQWQPWEVREIFDPSPAFGYKPLEPKSGTIRIPGLGIIKVSAPDKTVEAASKGPPDLLVDLSRGVGLNRAAFESEGVDPAAFKENRISGKGGFRFLFPKEGGLTPDGLLEFLQENGYLPPNPDNAPATLFANDAMEILDRALRGERIISDGNFQAEEDFQTALRAENEPSTTEIESVIDEPILPGDEQAAIDEYMAAWDEYQQQNFPEGESDGTKQTTESKTAETGGERRQEGRQPIQPSDEAQQGLFPAAIGEETTAAAVKAADDERAGKGQDFVPAEEGEGELFAGNEPGARPEQNKIFTEDAANAARERLKSKLGTARAGFDPEMLKDAATVAGFHIERGARTFTAFSKAMIKDFGDAIRPYLKRLYEGVRDKLQIEGMDENVPEFTTEVTVTQASSAEAANPESDGEGVAGQLEKAATQQKAISSVLRNSTITEETDSDGLSLEDARLDPVTRDMAKLIGFFESATDKLRRSGHKILVNLATKVDAYYDGFEKRMGQSNGALRPILKKIPVGQKKATFQAFKEYWQHHDNGRVDEANSLLEANPLVRELVEKSQELYSDMGDINQSIGVQVYDAKLKKGRGGWRRIGKIPKGRFWPRVFTPDVQRVLSNHESNPKLWNELIDALINEGFIKTRIEANKFLRGYMGNEIANDYFSGIEKARTGKLPEIFYDYSWDAFNRYARKWASRITQIEQFGQVTGKGTMDAFDRVIRATNNTHTQNYVAAIADHVYSRRPTDIYTKILNDLNLMATATQLGNPATSTLNLIGGTTLNVQMFGWLRVAKSYASMVRNFDQLQQSGVELGILGKDVLNILRDTEQSSSAWMDTADKIQEALAKFASFSMKWGGYKGTENIIRMNAMVSSSIQLQDALYQWNKNPQSSISTKYRAFMQQNRINPDTLMAENGAGPETSKYLRLMVNIPQGSYRIDQVPLYVDSPVGRFLFKYQKFGTQVSRMFWQNFLRPFLRSVRGNKETNLGAQQVENPSRVQTFLPLLRYFSAAFVGGSAILAARSFLFNYNDPGPDWDDLEEALKDDERALTWALIFDRAFYSMMAASAAGFFGNYIQFGLAVSDQQRAKNPLDPPGLATLDGVQELVMRFMEQGKLTARDMDQISERTMAMYRAYKRAGLKFLTLSGAEWKEARLRDAAGDVTYVRKMTRRYADEIGAKKKRAFTGRFARTPASPVYQKIYEHLILGDGTSARAVIRQVLRENKDITLANIKSSTRSRHPFNVGRSTSLENHVRFRRWAKKNMSPANYQRTVELGRRYDLARRRAGLSKK